MDNILRVQRAQSAAITRAEALPIIEEFSAGIVETLISHYKSGRLTDLKIYGLIGELAGMRKLTEELNRRLADGEIALEEIESGQESF